METCCAIARLAQSAERKALNLVVVGSSPTVGVFVALAFACLTGLVFSCAPRFRRLSFCTGGVGGCNSMHMYVVFRYPCLRLLKQKIRKWNKSMGK